MLNWWLASPNVHVGMGMGIITNLKKQVKFMKQRLTIVEIQFEVLATTTNFLIISTPDFAPAIVKC